MPYVNIKGNLDAIVTTVYGLVCKYFSQRGRVQTTWTIEGGGGCSDDHNT